MPAQQKESVQKGENQVRTKYFREWRGVFTKNSRTAIPQDTFYDLTNLIPIGGGNLHTVADISSALVNYGSDSIYWAEYANINSTDYLICFASNGKVFAYNIAANTSAQINVGKLLSGANSRMDQWKSQYILFYDTTGYYSWDGTTFTGPITGGIIPGGTPVSPDIAVFSNRVWLYSGRALYVSAINSVTDFTLVNGAITQILTDPQLRGESTRLFSASGYLYILGKSSIFVISDVYIPSGASPPAPVFTVLNVQANIGCDQPASVFVYNRDLMFANTYGLWRLSGVTAEKVSDDIDGTIQWIDTSFSISGGAAQVQNILQAGFLIKQTNDPVFGTRTIVANYFDKKWWFANYGNLTFVAGAIKSNRPVMFGFIGNVLYQLYQNTASSQATRWMTPLWPMEDSLSDKEVFRAGAEITVTTAGNVTLSLDTPNASNSFVSQTAGLVYWTNNSGSITSWKNNSNAIVSWYTGSYLLYYGDSLGGYGKYVGLTGSVAAGAVYELNANMMDYTLRKRW
jgi:hypothetical protein